MKYWSASVLIIMNLEDCHIFCPCQYIKYTHFRAKYTCACYSTMLSDIVAGLESVIVVHVLTGREVLLQQSCHTFQPVE